MNDADRFSWEYGDEFDDVEGPMLSPDPGPASEASDGCVPPFWYMVVSHKSQTGNYILIC